MKLAFREFGTGTPLIILHGLFGQSDNWNTLAKNFAEQHFHVFTVDQRNHGLSPHSDEWTYDLMADDLFEFINDHHLNSPILLGHSMGAKTVLFFEKKHPGFVSKIILADMAAKEYPPHHASVFDALHAVDLKTINSRKEAEAAMNEHISDFGTKQFLLKNIYWKDDKTMDWRFNLGAITRHYDEVRKPVPNFKSEVPSLIIAGENSNYILEADKKDYESRFSNLRFETIAGAGHWVHAEKPAEFQKAVLNFIKD